MPPTDASNPDKAVRERMVQNYDDHLNDVLLGAFCDAIEAWKDKPHIILLDIINAGDGRLLRAVINDPQDVYQLNQATIGIIRDRLKSKGL